MLERNTTRSYFEDILCDEFDYITKEDLCPVDGGRQQRRRRTRSRAAPRPVAAAGAADGDGAAPAVTRGARSRRPRVPDLQAGYCAVCSAPYNSVAEHVRSRKHRKLVGEDGGCVALAAAYAAHDDDDAAVGALLGLDGIDAIGLEHEFSPKSRRRAMPRTRAPSVASERRSNTRAPSVASEKGLNSTPLSPAGSDHAGHHLRSRKNVNYSYMTPPMEDDSFQEKPDLEPVRHYQYKEYRELRSSTRALAKLTSPQSQEPEVWNSGRPKRSCIGRQRISADERLVNDNKTYYKVEVLSNKLRSNDNSKDKETEKRLRSPKQGEEKGLIVKFKKLRNTELVQLNNEATNFLFPKRDDSSEEDTDVDADGPNTTVSSTHNDTTLLSSDVEEVKSPPPKFKMEDESSMDSTVSSETAKKKRKRRTQAEAFINDNQKYYKFEMPGSSSCRLRYHGSYLPTIIKSPKSNGECTPKVEKEESDEKPDIKDIKPQISLDINNYEFSFESVPNNTSWYQTFQRQDQGRQHYFVGANDCWDEFVLPYQMPYIKPLNPKVCISAYNTIKEALISPSPTAEHSQENNKTNDEEQSESESISPTTEIEMQDEDSKTSGISVQSTDNPPVLTAEEQHPAEEPVIKKRKRKGLARDGGKNPRKSPRQHASTLAILSGLIQQRKRKSKIKEPTEPVPSLPPIQEEPEAKAPLPTVEEEIISVENPVGADKTKVAGTPGKKKTPKVDYSALANRIDEELDAALDNLEELDLELAEEEMFDFQKTKVTVGDIITMCERERGKQTENCRRFFNGTPGRKPGKRKKNKTGWPKKTRRTVKKCQKEKPDDDSSTLGSEGVHADSDMDDGNSTDSNKDAKALNDVNTDDCDATGGEEGKGEAEVRIDEAEEQIDDAEERKDEAEERKDEAEERKEEAEPYVCVAKLETDKVPRVAVVRRTARPRRKMPGSPKSPRMLRKPRGRWYRER